jgi:hypothetical protein
MFRTNKQSDIEWVQRRALDYAEKVRTAERAYSCKHGHVDCAAWEGGACLDEILINANIFANEENV